MNFSIWWVAVAFVLGFIFGAAISAALDSEAIKRWRRQACLGKVCANTLADSCRAVLADSWFHKVMKDYKRRIDEYAAKESK